MGGRDPSIRQRVEMVITTKDDLFNVRSKQRPFLNVGSAAAASGLLTECTWNMYMYM